MDAHQQQWYVLRSGKTVGPLSFQEVADALDRREFHPGDKISGSVDRHWRTFRDDLLFHRFIRRRQRGRAKLPQPKPLAAVLKNRQVKPSSPDSPPEKTAHGRRWTPVWVALPLLAALWWLVFTKSPPKPAPPPGTPAPSAQAEKRGSSNEEFLPPSSSPRPATDSPEDSDPGYLPRPPTRPRRL